MKTKVFTGLMGILMLVILSGCGGGNSGTPVTSNDNGTSGTNSLLYFSKPASSFSSTINFQDDFNDADFNDKWFQPEIDGNYTVAQSGGVMEISGFGVPNPDPDGYNGNGRIRAKGHVCAENPFEIGVDLNLSSTISPFPTRSDAVSQAVLVIGDGFGKSVFVGIGFSTFCGSGLFFGTEGTPPGPGCPPVIATSPPMQGRLTIKYNNGNYEVDYGTLSFTFSPASYRTFTGPVSVALFGGTRVDVVHPNFPTVLGPAPSVPPPSVDAKFDNFVFKGSLCPAILHEKCDMLRALKEQILQIPREELPIKESIAAKLEAACRSIERAAEALQKDQLNVTFNMLGTATDQLEALINEVDAQTNKKIAVSDAADFKSFLQDCIAQLKLWQQLLIVPI